MPHLTSIVFVSRVAILDFEVPRYRIFTEITAEILFVTVLKMKVSALINIWVGCVGNIDRLPVGKVGKKVPIGLPPLLCFGGFLGWHGAIIWREGSGVFLCLWYVCGKWNKK